MQDPRTPIPGHTFGTCIPWYKYARLHTFQSIMHNNSCINAGISLSGFSLPISCNRIQFPYSTSRIYMYCGHRTVLMSKQNSFANQLTLWEDVPDQILDLICSIHLLNNSVRFSG